MPFADAGEDRTGFFRETACLVRPGIEQEIAAERSVKRNLAFKFADRKIILVAAVAPAVLSNGVACLGGFGERIGGLCLKIAFGRGKIARPITSVIDHCLGLERIDQLGHGGILPSGDIHIPPDAVDRAVIGAEFADLAFQVIHIGVHIIKPRIGDDLVVAADIRIGGMVPVDAGIIDFEREIAFVTFVGQHPQDILAVWGVHDVVIGFSGVPHAEAVMVLGSKNHVFHAGLLREIEPLGRIEFLGVELCGILLIFRGGNVQTHLMLFVDAADGIDPPMDEHPETFFVEPVFRAAQFLHGC